MDRKAYEQPMEFEWSNEGPIDPSSPFAHRRLLQQFKDKNSSPFALDSTSKRRAFTPAFAPNPFSLPSSRGTSQQLAAPDSRNTGFITPWKPLDVDELNPPDTPGDDENLPFPPKTKRSRYSAGSSGRPLSLSSARRRVPKHSANPPSRSRSVATRRKPIKFNNDLSSDETSDVEERSTRSDNFEEPADTTDSGRAHRNVMRSVAYIPLLSHDDYGLHATRTSTFFSGHQPTGYAPFLLISLYIGGNFYYKVVSVSILAVWIYNICIFRGTRHMSDPRRSAGLWARFCMLALDLAKTLGLLALVSWCVMLSPIHIFIPTIMDGWTRYSDHPTFRSFEVLHDPGDFVTADVFAIHGLGSNPLSAWRYAANGTEVYWLRDLLPKQKGLENIKVTMLNHQTRWDSHSPEVDFDVLAKMILDDIEHLHHENRPIIFIAHSFGGLLLKRSLVLATTRSKHIPQMTKGILFLGVPHYGTKAAFIASLLACTAYWRGSSTSMLEYLSESNPAVAALDDEFYEAYGRPSRIHEYSEPYICNFLEMRPESFGKLSLKPTVNVNSGSLRYTENVLLDSDHRGLNKFQSSKDPNFEKFLRHVYRAFRDI